MNDRNLRTDPPLEGQVYQAGLLPPLPEPIRHQIAGRRLADYRTQPLDLDSLDEQDITAGAQAIAVRAGLGPWELVHTDYQRFLTGDVRAALKAIRDRHL